MKGFLVLAFFVVGLVVSSKAAFSSEEVKTCGDDLRSMSVCDAKGSGEFLVKRVDLGMARGAGVCYL